jgi:hypothetical protein
MRTHGLYYSFAMLSLIMEGNWIERDVSLFLPYHPRLEPVHYRYGGHDLWRIPYFWEDDDEMERASPNWDLSRLLKDDAQLAVFDFHPIHVFLNSASCHPYQNMKRKVGPLSKADPMVVSTFIQPGAGTGTAA